MNTLFLKLQIPSAAEPGKSVVWNNIKGGIGIRWYEVELDRCDRTTRAYEHELREFRDGDVVPEKDKLVASAKKSITNQAIEELTNSEQLMLRSDFGSSPVQDHINFFSPKRPEV